MTDKLIECDSGSNIINNKESITINIDHNNNINHEKDHLSCLRIEVQFILLGSICFIGFWLCGYVEELMFGQESFECGWFLATFELTFFCIITSFGNIWNQIDKLSINNYINIIKISFKPKSPFYIHIIIGFAMTFARSLTLFSLIYLNYPTQVIFKSMKLLFVLLGSYMCFGLKYSFLEIIGHFLMVFAAILFSLGDHETQTRFTSIGVILVLSSLIFDSIHANFQEYALRKCNSSFSELMIFSNGIAAINSCLICILSKEIFLVIEYIKNHPNIWFLFLIRSCSIYIGAVAYLSLTKRFGAVIASQVTTARKVVTILTSYYLFPKPFVNLHQIGFLSFGLAVFASIYSKRLQKDKSQNSKQ